MPQLFIALLMILSLNLNAQNMNEAQNIVTKLFVATDQHDWQTVENCFAKEVILDYSSMAGSPAATLAPAAIIESWKGILPGFEHTHHQLGNFLIQEIGNQIKVFCYGTATHYLTDEKGNLWTVVGSYDFDLVKSGKQWRISKMQFNFKYQTGNTELPQKAMEKLKQ